jgi:hypothetical protein
VVGKSVHTNIKQTAPGQTLYNLQHLLYDIYFFGDFAIMFFFSSTSSFNFVGLHRSISGKLVTTVLPNNPKL